MTAHKPPNKKSRPTASESSVSRVRNIKPDVRLQLFVAAGGRCEFPGCNDYLLVHRHTQKPGNFAQMAHIVAFGKAGPRANKKLAAKHVNDHSNLMLLCGGCHKEIDSRPEEYPVENLREFKAAHEERIHHLTSLRADLKTTVLKLVAKIAGRPPMISLQHITNAVKPRYPADSKGIVIDVSQLATTGELIVDAARLEIRAKIADLHSAGLDGRRIEHLSVFALAPIPILIALGRELSDKLEVDFFQRHRDTENWAWKADGADVVYQFRKIRDGAGANRVALLLSLSGTISAKVLPAEVSEAFTVYEITLGGQDPSPFFLRKKSDLASYRQVYMLAMRQIMAEHPELKDLHVFPAVPAPVALVCGHALLPKADPQLVVYDMDRSAGGFKYATTVNQ